MNLLFLTTQLPYPPKSGGVIKSFRLIKHWSEKHDVTLACLLKKNEKHFLAEFSDILELKGVISEECDIQRNGINLLASYLKGMTLNVFRNFSKSFLDKINAAIESMDLIFVDHYEMYEYIKRLNPQIPVVLHEHNAEFVMWQRLAEIEGNVFKKAVLEKEASRIKEAELSFINHATLTMAAPNDIDQLVSAGAKREKFVETYHLGEDEMIQWPPVTYSQTELRLLYIGTLTWEANVDGLVWFLKNVWPELRSKNPGVQMDIIGKNPDRRILDLTENDNQITLLGFVDDLRNAYDKSRVFICPLRFGSGIKVKVLNAMYRGIPTVTTDIGVEGLDLKNGREMFFNSTDPDLFAEQVTRLLVDEKLWNQMRDAVRKKAQKYTWSSLLESHDSTIATLVS